MLNTDSPVSSHYSVLSGGLWPRRAVSNVRRWDFPSGVFDFGVTVLIAQSVLLVIVVRAGERQPFLQLRWRHLHGRNECSWDIVR